MAKKVIASSKKTGRDKYVKVVYPAKSLKTGAQTFKSQIMSAEKVGPFLEKNLNISQ